MLQNETRHCIMESCGKEIHPLRIAMKPSTISTCSPECAKAHKRDIDRKAQRKYVSGKRRTDPVWVERQNEYQRQYRAAKKAG